MFFDGGTPSNEDIIELRRVGFMRWAAAHPEKTRENAAIASAAAARLMLSGDARDRISAAHRGKSKSEEWKRKMVESRRKNYPNWHPS